MEQQKVDMFLTANQQYFPADKIVYLKEKLLSLPDERYSLILTTDFKNPTAMLVISLFLGGIGVDRFMLGDTGMGVLKLLTAGGCGILAIIDWFSITKRTKEYNFNKFIPLL